MQQFTDVVPCTWVLTHPKHQTQWVISYVMTLYQLKKLCSLWLVGF